MKSLLTSVCVIIFFCHQAFAESNDSIPVQSYVLNIDGVAHEIVESKTLEIVVDGKTHQVSLEKNKTRKFSKAGLTFDFDAAMNFAFEAISPEVDHWSMDGNDAVIMVQKYTPVVPFSIIEQSFVSQYRSMKAGIKVTDTTLSAGGQQYAGKRLSINLGDIYLVQELYYFKGATSATVLVLQDTLVDNGAHTQEFTELRKMVEKTMSVDLSK